MLMRTTSAVCLVQLVMPIGAFAQQAAGHAGASITRPADLKQAQATFKSSCVSMLQNDPQGRPLQFIDSYCQCWAGYATSEFTPEEIAHVTSGGNYTDAMTAKSNGFWHRCAVELEAKETAERERANTSNPGVSGSYQYYSYSYRQQYVVPIVPVRPRSPFRPTNIYPGCGNGVVCE
jgi:hypothetical protein